MTDTTCDAFLGGRLTLEQPARGYRAGLDPVLLAAAVKARAGETVLELGCGAGAALLCLGTRVPGLVLHGVEVQPAYAELCRRNAARNGMQATIWDGDLRALPPALSNMTFHHVLANPPYFEAGRGKASALHDRDLALRGDTTTANWIETATRRLRPKGWLTLIHKADRLHDVLRAMDDRLGAISVYPITGRAGRPADRVLVRAHKGARGPFRLHPPVHLHDGPQHRSDQPDYRPEIGAILRDGASFPLPD
ncbi:tRNA1(Val) (adenine(37)-N6)-methyltransferase [Thalassorhabdomicrobium marinisediminis]|uniref:Methyltransferase n=1 Tax=Thalassorhabdomicrobium marinisediminis TaxID=2170577 RepID=A0A2T7FYX1_9RHOB|nr:methyltransferase [Thalassorhabdomicrobium marinisediminis]PVA07359.1 methyltransferase [Thalassorhabdomicrobium marinisediminis]